MVTAVPTTTTNGCDVDVANGRDLSLKIKVEAIAEFDRLKELVNEIRRTQKGLPDCEEYEKMVSGKPLDRIPNDSRIPDATMYRALRATREDALRSILGAVGRKPVIEPPFNFEYGFNIIMGDGVYANVNLRILDGARVTVGNHVLFGPNVTVLTETHDKDIQSRRDGIVFTRPVTIGDDCWIGAGTTVLPGVTIGKGCTIGAGSLVTKNIPDFSVAYGVPARVAEKVADPDAPKVCA
ncbi:hypothetical protein FQN54_005757 [Arachnomyces sp. PD_36]|nr:hypothetical protein FQN54_005757 [Arachnomyces sp. PD_36]